MRLSKARVASLFLVLLGLVGVAIMALPAGARSEKAAPPATTSPKRADTDKDECMKIPALREGVLAFIGTPAKQAGNIKRVTTITLGDRTITYVTLHQGDRVEAGQLMAQLADRAARAEIEIGQAKLQVAEADERAAIAARDEAKNGYDRYGLWLWRLNQSTSKEAIDAARLTWLRYLEEAKSKRAAVEQTRAELKKAELDLERYQIRAPVRGIIRNIKKHTGEAVMQFETVIEIAPATDR